MARFRKFVAVALGGALLALAACGPADLCSPASNGRCASDCRTDAGSGCPNGLTCELVMGLACSTSDPDCNGWFCVSPSNGG
jgi:hypothetical protein